jgi:hypothetical protein
MLIPAAALTWWTADRARSLGLGGLETGILADAVRTSAYKCLTTLDLSGNPLKADDIAGLIKVRVARDAARVGLRAIGADAEGRRLLCAHAGAGSDGVGRRRGACRPRRVAMSSPP